VLWYNSAVRYFPLILILLSVSVHAQQLLSTKDLTLPVSLSEAKISPDGKKAVFIVTRRDYESNSATGTLMLVDLQSRAQRTLSRQKGITDPSWSPASERISYLAATQMGPQIFVLPLNAKGPQQITRLKGGILHHTWSPDGKRFAFIAQDMAPPKKGPERFNNAFEAGSNDYLTSQPAAGNYAAVVAVGGGKIRRITQEGITVATDFSNSSLSWSPDGSKLSINVYPSSRSGDNDLGRVHLLDLATGSLQPLTQLTGQMGPGMFSADGSRVLFSYPRDGVPSNESEVYAVGASGGESKSITRALDREIFDFASQSDGRLLLSGYDGLKSAIWLLSGPDDFTTLDLGDVMEVLEFSANKNGSIIFIGDEIYRPDELYFKSSVDAKPTRITSFNRQIAERKQGKREGFSWKSTNNFEADGVLTYPPDFKADARYPLVLLIHGGPTAASTLAFHMTAQLMAAKGWIVFEPNYRGSNHRGNAFESAIANDAGEGPGQDVMSGVTELKTKPFVDPKRIAVSGWSYGGWMTAWMIGRYPDEWAAAVAGAAPVDYTDMYSLSDLNRMRRHAITDSPYKGDNLQRAWQQSPIKNFSKIRTPTLVLSKSSDSRVAITGSYKLYNALRDNGVKTQFIVYPGAGHLVTDPVRSKDVYDRWLRWLEQFLAS
jgi:dipeptidyl aminopeptidase/acylaminoacyl peptidase